MSKLFGFEIQSAVPKKDRISFAPPKTSIDPAISPVGGAHVWRMDNEQRARTENELIKMYREMATHPEIEGAIEEIINEAFVYDTDEDVVTLNSDNLNVSDKIKKIIHEEFETILELLDFKRECYSIFRQFYIDGRLPYHIIIDDDKPQEGIKELRYVDPLLLKHVREPVLQRNPQTGHDMFHHFNEYFVYNPLPISGGMHSTGSGFFGLGTPITLDSILYVNSGLMDRHKNVIISYLDKAIRPLNNLRALEDSAVIYRLVRAPSRRAFYIDVNDIPAKKADEYVQRTMQRFRNKIDYDVNTGAVRDAKRFMSMLEDYWLPRRGDSKSTEIQNIDGSGSWESVPELDYFRSNLHKALSVPVSRLEKQSGFSFGRNAEITREEIKFTKFVARLRHQFSNLFSNALEIQLSLKKVMTRDDWKVARQYINYDFLEETVFEEMKALEIFNEKLDLLDKAAPHIGRFFSMKSVRKEILGQTEEIMAEIDAEINDEIKGGEIKTDDSFQTEAPFGANNNKSSEGEESA